jgi:hypothetical protein
VLSGDATHLPCRIHETAVRRNVRKRDQARTTIDVPFQRLYIHLSVLVAADDVYMDASLPFSM